MKKFSQSKQWLLAGSTLFFAFACQSNGNQAPPSADREYPAGRDEERNRMQERIDRRMEERDSIERGGNQGPYVGEQDEQSSSGGLKCNPCEKIRKCAPMQGEARGEQSPYPDRDPNYRGRYKDRPIDNVSSDVMQKEEGKEAAECTSEEPAAPIASDVPAVTAPAVSETPVAAEPAAESVESSVAVVPEVKAEEASASQASETAQK